MNATISIHINIKWVNKEEQMYTSVLSLSLLILSIKFGFRMLCMIKKIHAGIIYSKDTTSQYFTGHLCQVNIFFRMKQYFTFLKPWVDSSLPHLGSPWRWKKQWNTQLCTLYKVDKTIYNAYSTLHIGLDTEHSTLYTVHCTRHTSCFTLYTS